MSNARDKANIPSLNFSSTGIDDNATSTAITIDSSEQIGIGTASPDSKLTVNGDVTLLGGDGGVLIFDNRDATVTDGEDIGTINFTISGESNITTTQTMARMEVLADGATTVDTTARGKINFKTSTGNSNLLDRMLIRYNGDISFYEDTGTTPKFFWDASTERLGIGTSSPANELDVNGSIRISQDGGVLGNGDEKIKFDATGQTLQFQTADTERMRIDSSGRLLINTTSYLQDPDEKLSVTGIATFQRTGNTAIFNRIGGSDGDLIRIRKDGTSRGSIGVQGGTRLYIANANIGLSINDSNYIMPCNSSGAEQDNSVDLGKNNSRFDDIFATNATIQTSDQNEKQSIQSLTTAEMNVAKRLSPLIKTFKWNSSVEEKGDSARTHTGIIAQDVQQAFTDEGLDAGNYALFISSTWWEKEISVDAVAEEVDENGNVITEAKDAYTYMDTKEEATDGYTERTRLGVRYPELLSFIQAYNDQRFTQLEARITTLENA